MRAMKWGTRIFLLSLVLVFAAGFLTAFGTLKIESKYAEVPHINNCFITQIKWECGGKCTAPTPDGYYASGWPFRAQKKVIICGETKENYLQTGRFLLDGLLYTLIYFAASAVVLNRVLVKKK